MDNLSGIPVFRKITAPPYSPPRVTIRFSGISCKDFWDHWSQDIRIFGAGTNLKLTINGDSIAADYVQNIINSGEECWEPRGKKFGQPVTSALIYYHVVEGGRGKTFALNYIGAETGQALLCIEIQMEGLLGDESPQFRGQTWLEALCEISEQSHSISTKLSESLVAALHPDNEAFTFNGNHHLTPADYPIWFQEAVVVTIEKIRNSIGPENSKASLTYEELVDWTYFTPLGQLERFLLEPRLDEQGERLSEDLRWERRLKESADRIAAQWNPTESLVMPHEIVIPGAFPPEPEKKGPRLRLFRRSPS